MKFFNMLGPVLVLDIPALITQALGFFFTKTAGDVILKPHLDTAQGA
jgi:hypothetical protein